MRKQNKIQCCYMMLGQHDGDEIYIDFLLHVIQKVVPLNGQAKVNFILSIVDFAKN